MNELITTWFEDEESQFIFNKRIEFNESNNYEIFREIIDKYIPEFSNNYYYPGKEKEIIEKVKEKVHIWIWGGVFVAKELLICYKTQALILKGSLIGMMK